MSQVAFSQIAVWTTRKGGLSPCRSSFFPLSFLSFDSDAWFHVLFFIAIFIGTLLPEKNEEQEKEEKKEK